MRNDKQQLISIGQINFINCLPVNYSFFKWHLERIVLSDGYPTFVNALMKEQQVHIAPISSIEYLKNDDKYSLIDSICISSDGEVGSVNLFSNYDLKNLEGKKIALPYTSASSIAFLKILLKENGVDLNSCQFVTHKYKESLKEALSGMYDAILYIGNPALIANINHSKEFIIYDLGMEWKKLTGYPMVFGTWVAQSDWKNKSEDDFEWIKYLLDKAVDTGLNIYFNEVMNLASQELDIDRKYIEDYLTCKIRYKFTERHRESLKLFKEMYSGLNISDNQQKVIYGKV